MTFSISIGGGGRLEGLVVIPLENYHDSVRVDEVMVTEVGLERREERY